MSHKNISGIMFYLFLLYHNTIWNRTAQGQKLLCYWTSMIHAHLKMLYHAFQWGVYGRQGISRHYFPHACNDVLICKSPTINPVQPAATEDNALDYHHYTCKTLYMPCICLPGVFEDSLPAVTYTISTGGGAGFSASMQRLQTSQQNSNAHSQLDAEKVQ